MVKDGNVLEIINSLCESGDLLAQFADMVYGDQVDGQHSDEDKYSAAIQGLTLFANVRPRAQEILKKGQE